MTGLLANNALEPTATAQHWLVAAGRASSAAQRERYPDGRLGSLALTVGAVVLVVASGLGRGVVPDGASDAAYHRPRDGQISFEPTPLWRASASPARWWAMKASDTGRESCALANIRLHPTAARGESGRG